VARFSKRDAETFRELAHVYRDVLADGMIPAMFSPPGPPSGDLTPLEGSVEGLGLIRQFLSAPNHVARGLFESPEVQTWLGFWVAQLAGTGDVFGLGANYPIMLAGSLEPYGWAICKGGSNQLAQAMVAFLKEHGGEVRLDTSTRPTAWLGPSSWTTARASRSTASCCRTWTRGTRSSSWSASPTCRPSSSRP
jgi:phytoene dehydrogenase-like protein